MLTYHRSVNYILRYL